LSDKSQSVLGLIFISVVFFFLIWNFFPKNSIEISNEKIHYGIISDRKISFTAKNSGPKNTYKYYVKIGDEFWNRFFSPNYCEGTFSMNKDEERIVEIECRDLNFTFTKYSVVIK
jgi:hypothetical protein